MITDVRCTNPACDLIEERYISNATVIPTCTRCGSKTTKLISSNWVFTFAEGSGKGTEGGTTYRFPKQGKIKRG